jgi:hypothetical protein
MLQLMTHSAYISTNIERTESYGQEIYLQKLSEHSHYIAEASSAR